MHYMTPVMVGLEYVEEYRHLPERRVEVLRKAAGRGLRAALPHWHSEQSTYAFKLRVPYHDEV